MIVARAAILFLLIGCLLAPAAVAQEAESGAPGSGSVEGDQRFEVAIIAGAGPGTVKDPERTSTSIGQAIVRFGFNLPKIGGGRSGSAFGILVEVVPYFTVAQKPRATGAGLNLMFRYQYAGERWRPMILFGAGIMKTDEEVPPGEVTRNYTPQGGLGVQYMLTPGFGLDLEYRFHHLSNNNQTDNNPGIDTQLFMFGFFWSF